MIMHLIRRVVASTLCTLSLILGVGWLLPTPASAQVTAGLQAVGQVTQLPSTDPRIIAARIINISLGLIAIILVTLIIYAGFLWMTAGGNPEQIEKAKGYIRNAVIGVIIVLSSWAIATFVINRLLQATGGGGGVAGGGGGGLGGGLGGGGASSFQVRSITPSGSVAIRNIEVRFLFTREVDPVSASTTIQILRANDNSPVAGAIVVNGSLISFTPEASCPDPNADRHCFDADTDFIARVGGSLRSVGGQTIACGGFAPSCEGRFHAGSLVDTANPSAQITSPLDGQSVPEDDLVPVATLATDDSGISYVESFSDQISIGRDTPQTTSTPTSFNAGVMWDTVGVPLGTHVLQSTAHDIDSNIGSSASVSVAVRPKHCFNGSKDADETGIDCGGSCGACAGGACTQNSQCSSGVCSGGVCVEQPIITGVTPNDGRPGTFVTVSGVNFGATPGKVIFSDGQEAQAPQACVANGVKTWSSSQIIITVPDAAKSGPIQVKNTVSNLSDATNDTRGPNLPDFTVNTLARPGLCAALPSHAQVGDQVNLVGAGLGSTADRVFFTDREIATFLAWADTAISLNVPVISPAGYAVKARSGGIDSNTVAFQIDERQVTGVPEIQSVDPESGPVGEYVTLTGKNFGYLVGTVKFKDPASGDEGSADVSFPAACSLGFWHDTSVVVKVPKTIGGLGNTEVKPGAYQISLVRQDRAQSNSVAFSVNNATPSPGLCTLQPNAGPVDTEVKLIGERFGSAPGSVTFRGADNARVEATVDLGNWKSGEILTHVPRGGVTGPVRVTVDQKTSNGVNFTVKNCQEDASICSRGETCCPTGACSVNGVCPVAQVNAQYAWRTSTGVIPLNPEVVEECNETKPPSPSPWIARTGGDRACLNADVIARFNTKLDPKTVTSANFLVSKCSGLNEDPCSGATPVPAAQGFPQLFAADTDTDYIVFRPNLPNGVWEASTTYQVILKTGIHSDTGLPMLEKASTCGKGNGYCFRFTTRQASETCKVGLVTVTPHPFTANAINQKIGYRAAPRAADDICIQLNGSSMDWSWSTGDGRASITNNLNPNPPGNVLDVQTGTALAETGDVPVLVNAEVQVPQSTSTRGTAQLFVRFIPPRIEAYGPNCDTACVNAALWARFNVAMRPQSFTPQNIILKRCTNENCRSFDPPNALDLTNASIKLMQTPGSPQNAPLNYLVVEPTHPINGIPTSYLEPGRFYKVIVRGGIQGVISETRLPLTELNDPEGFAWTFRVKEGDNARCAVAKVDVVPAEKFETLIGSRQLFNAQPLGSPDACNASGQPLISDRSYAWTSSDTDVAKLVNGSGDGLIDTTNELSPHCSNRCISTGADGLAGHVASCGNGIIETTDTRYCRKGNAVCNPGDQGCTTPFGDACTVLPPDSKGSEECDLGGNNNNPNSTCGSLCLWNSARSVIDGGSCGNGVVDRGEQCDPGKSCTVGPFLGKTCVVDADCGGGGTCGVATRNGCSGTCQALGARAGGSTCGNNDLGDGETCDDGNTTPGDGCSADCLHEGSSQITALCGNTILEPGESCEKTKNGLWPAYCDTKTCLNKGTPTCASLPQGEPKNNCCGNAKVEGGESCDDGNSVSGDGCSSACLSEGSSVAYPKPSICGDGVLGTGEQCEAVKPGDGLVDASQLGEITGTREPDPDGRMSSDLQATYETKKGQAVYGLQCGFKEEASCAQGFGLTNGGCCAPRPSITANYPQNGAIDVCRNVLISGTFNVVMDPASLQTNFLVAKEGVQGNKCPAGTQPLAENIHGWRAWLAALWQNVISFFHGSPAQAVGTLWCVGSATGKIVVTPDGNGTKVSFILDSALEANTRYRVWFRGDANLQDAIKEGIKSLRGVVAEADPVSVDSGPLSWSFLTGTKVCAVNQVIIRDTNADHPFLFSKQAESHVFEASVNALQDGKVVPLSGVKEYTWSWEPWVSSQTDILTAKQKGQASDALSTADVTADNKNGSSLVFAGIKITLDDVNVPSTTGQILRSSKEATVIVCERPWPSLQTAPFADQESSLSLKGTIFENGPFYNFSTLYCMDNGAPGPLGDLPSMLIHPIPTNAADASRGVLRQYLYTFTEDRLKGDGIGIRIVSNPVHLSPAVWYASRGFTGSPQSITIDGYEAVKDGTTIYVASANVDKSVSGPVTSTIYLISHNPDAKPETLNIYEQMVNNWTFNVNFQNDSQNVCVDGGGNYYLTKDGATAVCTADWECANYGNNLRCASFKAKLQRDTRRIADFQTMSGLLEGAKQRDGAYPLLVSGSFLQTITTSRWPSWQQTLGAALQGRALPQDPINKFLTCGLCRDAKTPCGADSDCPTSQDVCQAQNGYDPATCWKASDRLYQCPKLDNSPSRIYQYRAVDGGARYEFATELEGPGSARYQPALVKEVKRCSNTGQLCQTHDPNKSTDVDCDFFSIDGKTLVSQGTCNVTGGSWLYQGICTGLNYGTGDVCGNGVIGPNEKCEVGQTRPTSCTTSQAKPGTKVQVCSDCKGFLDGASTSCVQDATCGNGRVDKYKCYGGAGLKYGQPCTTPSQGNNPSVECTDLRDATSTVMQCLSVTSIGGTEEVCDDGGLNGTYGHCNNNCSGVGAYCGDGLLSLGEICDNGQTNGDYCDQTKGCNINSSCSIDCRGIGPYCGDGKVQSPPEACDGNIEQTTSSLCKGGNNAERPCSAANDCPGGSCGGDDTHKSCVGLTLGLCAGGKNANSACSQDGDCPEGRCVQYPTRHSRSCVVPGQQNQCTWDNWSACNPIGTCGDGHVDAGEECDDGNASNNDTCTNQCKKNVCGDGLLQQGIEECDFGSAKNTSQCPSLPDYGSTCVGCSNACHFVASSGGYCGDKIKNGPEQCDGDATISNDLTCKALGFDYAAKIVCDQYDIYCVNNAGELLAIYTSCDPNVLEGSCGGNGIFKTCGGHDGLSCIGSAGNSCQQAGGILTQGGSQKTVDTKLFETCKPSPTPKDIITCNNVCGLTGCKRCQDEPGSGVISGSVYDAVYSNEPIPNARVTVFLRGIKVGETFTDENGNFTLSKLNTRPECGIYRVIVDSYTDNPCTGNGAKKPLCNNQPWPQEFPTVDEGKFGGYWSYESNTFAISNFLTQGIQNKQGKIFLIPRIGSDETLAVFTWNGDISQRPIDMHLLLPKPSAFAYCYDNDPNGDCAKAKGICSGPPPDLNGVCPALPYWKRIFMPSLPTYPGAGRRDIAADDYSLRQVYQVGWLPYGNLHCFSSNGTEVQGCVSSDMSVQTMRFKRGNWALTGDYSLYLVDRNPGQPPPYQYFSNVSSTVRIVTGDRFYTVTPPQVADTCSNPNDPKGQYWLVFQQSALSGVVTVNNQLLCKGTTTPGEPDATKLPEPLTQL